MVVAALVVVVTGGGRHFLLTYVYMHLYVHILYINI